MAANEILEPEHVAWCRRHFAMLNDGGVWGIPRSGLVFQKQGDKLVLIAEMPWMPEMTGVVTPEQLREQQDAEFEANRLFFEAAGVEVVKAETIYREDPRNGDETST